MKRIIFHIGSSHQRRIGIGNIIQICQSIYFRAKSWGYTDIWFEWPLRVTCGPEYINNEYVSCPKETILPINLIEKNNWSPDEFDKVIDLTDADSMYDGYIPLYERKTMPVGKVSRIGIMNYPNIYFRETGEKPIFSIKPDKIDKPYILFHFRYSNWSSYRNSDPRNFKDVYDILNERYRDKYEFWKCGERFRAMDRLFDNTTSYYDNDIDKLFRLVNNSSLFVGAAAGVMTMAERFGVPQLVVDEVRDGKDGISGGERSKDMWKREGGIGNSYCDWLDDDESLIFWKEDNVIDKNKILEFTEKWLN